MASTQQKIEYGEVIDGIKDILESTSRDKEAPRKFYKLLSLLKDNFGIELSREFLISIMDNKDSQKARKKVNSLLRRAGLGMEKRTRWYNAWVSEVSKPRNGIIDYTHEEGNIYSEMCELSESEKAQIEEVKSLRELGRVTIGQYTFNFSKMTAYPLTFRPIEEQKKDRRAYKRRDDRYNGSTWAERQNIRDAINKGGKVGVVFHGAKFENQKTKKEFIGHQHETFNFIGGF